MGKVITVTREFGSMGRKIAKLTAEKMNFKYYDRDIIELTAKELRGSVEELSNFEDKKISVFQKMMYPLGKGTSSMQNTLYEMEKSVILDLASAGNCVIVGRCSDYILHECGHKDMLSVFIYAPYDKRIINSENELGLSQEMAEDCVEKVDKARQDFYRLHTGESFYSPKYRNLIIDSSIMSHEKCAEVISEIARAKFKME